MLKEYLGQAGIEYNKGDKNFLLPNGSIIELRSAESKDNLRGEGLTGCLVDECAEVNEEVIVEAIMPALADHDGWLWLISTPRGFNWFYEFAQKVKTKDDWFVMEGVPTWANPLMTEVKIRDKIEEMGIARWRQEHLGVFVSAQEALFEPELFEDVLIKEMPTEFERSVIAVDLSMGYLASDYQSVCFAGFYHNMWYTDFTIVRQPIQTLLDTIKQVWERYKADVIIIESVGMQAIAAEWFDEKFNTLPIPVYNYPVKGKKEARISQLHSVFARKEIKVLNNTYGRMFVNQCRDFPSKEAHDDGPDSLQMALAYLTNG